VNPQSATAFLSVFARELVKFPQPKRPAQKIIRESDVRQGAQTLHSITCFVVVGFAAKVGEADG
jgi:hypothetical protein